MLISCRFCHICPCESGTNSGREARENANGIRLIDIWQSVRPMDSKDTFTLMQTFCPRLRKGELVELIFRLSCLSIYFVFYINIHTRWIVALKLTIERLLTISFDTCSALWMPSDIEKCLIKCFKKWLLLKRPRQFFLAADFSLGLPCVTSKQMCVCSKNNVVS